MTTAVEALQRIAVCHPDITTKQAATLLRELGKDASPGLTSTVLSETKKLLRYLDRHGLLVDNFEKRRTRIDDDLFS